MNNWIDNKGENVMIDSSVIVKKLIGFDNLYNVKAEEIIEHVYINLYEKDYYDIRENEIFNSLPVLIKDIILLIDFDTELNMNGILGFLENSTGLYLDDTIEVLERIGATEDYEILKNIKDIMLRYNVGTKRLRDNVNQGSQYEITSFLKIHGQEYYSMAEEINIVAEGLYINHYERNIFDSLNDYIDLNKNNMIHI